MRRRGGRAALLAAGLTLFVVGPGCAGQEGGRTPGTTPDGYTSTAWAASVQALHAGLTTYRVSPALPELRFSELAAAMLTDEGAVRVSERVRAAGGTRVRLRGFALPLGEWARADRFVLHDEPFVRCVHVHLPAANRNVLVRLEEGVRFDFTDAPLWVEGTLRIGRFETFREGQISLFALEGARFEVLPPDRMDLPVLVPRATHPEAHLHPDPGGPAGAGHEGDAP